ncbi:hypothetical protein [Aliivibrio fischeri]|uniref:hypothetical protein n=1 Tax=Aliivibrio fischeri TaxID=668 RepID=UPI0007C4F406|nr:hypothetical protein [Aliivibrio fischeri]
MTKQDYKNFYSQLRYARNITLTKLSLDMIDTKSATQEIKAAKMGFPTDKLSFTISYDSYDSIYAFSWVIFRAMNVQNKAGMQAMQLSDKFKQSFLGEKTDYHQTARCLNNKAFYHEIVTNLITQ